MTKESLIKMIVDIVRKDLKEETLHILKSASDNDFDHLRKYAKKYLPKKKDSFANICCIELDIIKTKLEYFGIIEVKESDLGISKDMIPELISKWRDEKIKKLI